MVTERKMVSFQDRLGLALVEAGFLTTKDLDGVREIAKKEGKRLTDVLVERRRPHHCAEFPVQGACNQSKEHLGYIYGDDAEAIAWLVPFTCILLYGAHTVQEPSKVVLGLEVFLFLATVVYGIHCILFLVKSWRKHLGDQLEEKS